MENIEEALKHFDRGLQCWMQAGLDDVDKRIIDIYRLARDEMPYLPQVAIRVIEEMERDIHGPIFRKKYRNNDLYKKGLKEINIVKDLLLPLTHRIRNIEVTAKGSERNY